MDVRNDRRNIREYLSSSDSSDTDTFSDSSDDGEVLLRKKPEKEPMFKEKSGGPLLTPDTNIFYPSFPPTEKHQKKEEIDQKVLDNDFEYIAKHGRLLRMSLTRRIIISCCQWTCKVLLYILAIMALIDIGIAPTSVDNYIYLNEQSAVAAGFLHFHGTIYGSPWPYFIIQTVSFGFMCLSFFLEWRCYPVRSMGLDLKWDWIPIALIDDDYVKSTIRQARMSFSPFGAAYDNYVYFMLFQAMLFFLVFLHIFIEGWNMMFFAVLYVIFGYWSIVIDIFYLVKIWFYAENEYRRYQSLKEDSALTTIEIPEK